MIYPWSIRANDLMHGISQSSTLHIFHIVIPLSSVDASGNPAVSFGVDALLASGQAQICFECLGDDMSKPRLRTAALSSLFLTVSLSLCVLHQHAQA